MNIDKMFCFNCLKSLHRGMEGMLLTLVAGYCLVLEEHPDDLRLTVQLVIVARYVSS